MGLIAKSRIVSYGCDRVSGARKLPDYLAETYFPPISYGAHAKTHLKGARGMFWRIPEVMRYQIDAALRIFSKSLRDVIDPIYRTLWRDDVSVFHGLAKAMYVSALVHERYERAGPINPIGMQGRVTLRAELEAIIQHAGAAIDKPVCMEMKGRVNDEIACAAVPAPVNADLIIGSRQNKRSVSGVMPVEGKNITGDMARFVSLKTHLVVTLHIM
jgi:hypothetical protein